MEQEQKRESLLDHIGPDTVNETRGTLRDQLISEIKVRLSLELFQHLV